MRILPRVRTVLTYLGVAAFVGTTLLGLMLANAHSSNGFGG